MLNEDGEDLGRVGIQGGATTEEEIKEIRSHKTVTHNSVSSEHDIPEDLTILTPTKSKISERHLLIDPYSWQLRKLAGHFL